LTGSSTDGRKRRGQRGNTMVEAVLVLVPLMAMIFAILDFSLVIFLKSTFQFAVREGVRYAITYQTETGQGHDISIKHVVQNRSLGFLGGAKISCIQINYYLPSNLTTPVTGANSNFPGNVVEVAVVSFPWSWLAPLSPDMDQTHRRRSPLALSASSSDVMQGLPVGSQTPPAR
jgi:hypothetical protein